MQKNGLEVAGSVCDSNRADNQHYYEATLACKPSASAILVKLLVSVDTRFQQIFSCSLLSIGKNQREAKTLDDVL